MVREGTHISIIAKLCNQRGGDGLWEDFVSTVTGFLDQRDGRMGQVELSDGAILSFAVVPLPRGRPCSPSSTLPIRCASSGR